LSEKKRYDLVVVTREPFPFGMAATNRMFSYLKPLGRKGIGVLVLVTRPTEKSPCIMNLHAAGDDDGIRYEYLHNTTLWPGKGKKLKKAWLLLSSYPRLATKLFTVRPAAIVTYTSDLYAKLLLLLLKPFLKFRLVIEETEYPKALNKRGKRYSVGLDLSLYRRADGMLVMTRELEQYYRGLGVKELFHLPMTVDISRFQEASGAEKKEKYFLYAGGSGGFVRDGVMDIVKAFDLFQQGNEEFRLVIAGPVNSGHPMALKIADYIEKKGLSEAVTMTGAVRSDGIPALLCGATAIVMAPPQDFESGGFPTKLGEFLASGTPVICTEVSDIPVYLDQTNCYLVHPGDIRGICHAMTEIVTNPKAAATIGRAGRSVAGTVFNTETYLDGLTGFLLSKEL
jgi:glycosyltransferase involved in cell wall biosynthesis